MTPPREPRTFTHGINDWDKCEHCDKLAGRHYCDEAAGAPLREALEPYVDGLLYLAQAETREGFATALHAAVANAALAATPAHASLDVDPLEIRQAVRDLIVTLDAPNPRYALQVGIDTIDYQLAHMRRLTARASATEPARYGLVDWSGPPNDVDTAQHLAVALVEAGNPSQYKNVGEHARAIVKALRRQQSARAAAEEDTDA